jgi:hypothetical protein
MNASDSGETEANGSQDDYTCMGNFDPLVARRIIRRFAEHKVRYEARDASSLDMAGAGIGDYDAPATRYPIHARINRIRLWVLPEDQEEAQRLIDEV